MKYLKAASLLIVAILSGCQTTSETQLTKESIPPSSKEQPKTKTPDGIKIIPYDRPEIQRQKIILPQQKNPSQKFDDGRKLPAYQQLIKKTQQSFKQAQWNDAEKYALDAQRLAPQSAESFMYLAMISNHKNQPKNAESLARRGLSYAQSEAMTRQLWLIILKSGQLQNNAQLIQEALSHL